MNIFLLDRDPEIAAMHLCDVHLNKMQVESAQMLANCFTPEELENAPKTQSGNVRKHSYFNHPCSKWVRTNINHAFWLARHACAMEQERYQRLEKYKPHFCLEFNNWAFWRFWERGASKNHDDELDFDPLMAIPIDAKCRFHYLFDNVDIVSKYRLYYAIDKAHLLKYTNTEIPPFITGITNNTFKV